MNRLATETSPYLLQHADNPVDWYPWGDEAFEAARTLDRPILLSIGYSTCHWCHVMAHESFEDDAIAKVMNDGFVCIKVDREERPDVDGVYMSAVQAMTGQGGWPMTIFMTADGEPFYTGTYFPPEDGHGRPGFKRVLASLQAAWSEQRDELFSSAAKVTEHIRRTGASGQSNAAIPDDAVSRAVAHFHQSFDADWGGFGGAPKFPSPGNLEFLLAADRRMPGNGTLELVTTTLDAMAGGGIYDQLGGGFSRYSVDERWLVPHFEKMLYDNAQLVRLYTHAYQVTGNPAYERIVRETLDYVAREMTSHEGGFYSAQDADSEGIEGKFFVWTVQEVDDLLGVDDGDIFRRAFGVTAEGNFRDPHHPDLTGRNVLTNRFDADALAVDLSISRTELDSKLERLRGNMFEARDKRVYPGLDDKVLTSWNGLMLAAISAAARVFDNADWRETAVTNARFLHGKMWQGGRLRHTYKDGEARIDGMLEDYAYLGLGLVELYKLTGDANRLTWADEIWGATRHLFHDDEVGGFFDTAADGEKLLVRQKSTYDAATPSGNGAAALLGLWLDRYLGRTDGAEHAREVISMTSDMLLRAPAGFGSIWQSIEFMNSIPRELVIVGSSDDRRPFERLAAGRYDPWLVLAPGSGDDPLPLFEGRDEPAGAVAYLCEDMVCRLPSSTVEELAKAFATQGG